MRDRYLHRDRLQHLDPVADCHEVYRTTALLEFPWDVQRALELALYRTFAIPTIASLLDDTGEFRLRAQRRYDDTGLLLITVVDSGPDSPAGRAAISRINRLHARFAISNDDFLYTLGTFVFVPLRWLDRWGWRPLTEVERQGMFHYYRRLGALMGIRGVPETLDAFETWFDAYEQANFAYGEPQRRTAVATRELVASWGPSPLRPAVRLGVNSMLDGPVRATFGFPDPPRWLPPLVSGALHARAAVERLLLTSRTVPRRDATAPYLRSHPDGFELSALGPDLAEPVAD